MKDFPYFKKDPVYNYENFERQSFKIYKFPESLNGIPIKIITYDNSIEVFRTSGIGCKRFLSQIYHNHFNAGSTYCGIDHLNQLYKINHTQRITQPGNKDDSKKIKYSDAIKEYLTKHILLDFYGFRKSTDAGHEKSIIESSKIYKFIFISPKILSAYCYDPFCTDFKEDVDFIFRFEDDDFIKRKNNEVVVCKITEEQVSGKSPFVAENFFSYTYWYQRLLLLEGINIKYFAGYTENEILIYPIPEYLPKYLSSLGLLSTFDKGVIQSHIRKYGKSNQILIPVNKINEKIPIEAISKITNEKSNEYYGLPLLFVENITDTADPSGCNLNTYNAKLHKLNKNLSRNFGYKLALDLNHNDHTNYQILKLNDEKTRDFIIGNDIFIQIPGSRRVREQIINLKSIIITPLEGVGGSLFYDINYSS